MKLLVTGAAGFIGYHLCRRLLADGHVVIGLDNLNDYYDVALKQARLAQLDHSIGSSNQFTFIKADLAQRDAIEGVFDQHEFDCVINLAAQAGVRYSIENPHSYVDSNVTGFLHILEGCRHQKIGHLIYASSSSVYGLDEAMPFSEGQTTDHPMALYGATKKANEMMAHSYSNLYDLPTTGLRFFTVYGPWGRPDMAYFSFVKDIIEGRPIKIFNEGALMRDFTYIDDIIEAITRLLAKSASPADAFDKAAPDTGTSNKPYRLFNIGNHEPVKLMDFITTIEQAVGKQAVKEFLPMQDGDVYATFADTSRLKDWVGFQPYTPLTDGIGKFVKWYKDYYNG